MSNFYFIIFYRNYSLEKFQINQVAFYFKTKQNVSFDLFIFFKFNEFTNRYFMTKFNFFPLFDIFNDFCIKIVKALNFVSLFQEFQKNLFLSRDNFLTKLNF